MHKKSPILGHLLATPLATLEQAFYSKQATLKSSRHLTYFPPLRVYLTILAYKSNLAKDSQRRHSPLAGNSRSSPTTPSMNRDTTLYFPDLDLDSEVPCTNNQPTKYGRDSIFFPPIVNDWETVNYNSPTHNGSFYGYLPTQEQVESNAVFSGHSHNVKHFSLSQVTNVYTYC